MAENKKKKTQKINIKISSIDKAEYQQIVLSNSNNPNKNLQEFSLDKEDYFNFVSYGVSKVNATEPDFNAKINTVN